MTFIRKNWILGAIVIVALAVWMLRGGTKHETPHPANQEVNAETAVVDQQLIETFLTSQGTVHPHLQATLSTKIMSTVEAVLVREGDKVSKGQPLARLEARDLNAGVAQASAALAAANASAEGARAAARMEAKTSEADIEQAEAAVQQARAQLSVVRQGARKQERAQVNLAVEQAKAQYNLAASEARRMKRLYDEEVITRQRLEQVLAGERVAKAAWESARQQADLTAEGSRKDDIRASEERLRQATAALAAAKARKMSAEVRQKQALAAMMQAGQAGAALTAAKTAVDYSIIRAPFSGIVTVRHVDPGDQVGPGAPVITVEDRSQWRIETDIAESEAARLRVGDQAQAQIDAVGKVPMGAEIVEIRPGGDPATRTVHIKAALRNNPLLKSGLAGKLIIGKGKQIAVVVPNSAIMDGEGLSRVWVVSKDNEAEMRMVTLGQVSGSKTIVLSGLSRGEKIAITNLDALTDGARVVPPKGSAQ